jgi:ABC-2 type transport system ATP-binding protein
MVTFYAGICGMRGTQRKDAVESVIARVGMTDAADRRVGTYSKGMLQRIGLAQAVVHDPQLVVLDEPTAGVDPLGAAAIGEIILELKKEGKTVLVCSHLLAQLESLCDRVAILHKGRLMVEGSVESLLASPSSGSLLVEGLDGAGLEAVQSLAKAKGGRCLDHDPAKRSLESIFMDVVENPNSKRKEDA